MASTRSWFNEGCMAGKYVPGAIVTTDKPAPRQWRIVSVRNEHDEQRERERVDIDEDFPSFATIRLSCFAVDDANVTAEMRVYLQVPYTNTQGYSSRVYAQQAVSWQPGELWAYRKITADPYIGDFIPMLLGYQETTQADRGLVPGGFHTTVVWQFLSGLQLGSHSSVHDNPFWTLSRSERDKIRTKFRETFK